MIEVLRTLTIVFGLAAVILLVARRLSIASTPLYLLTGLVVGAFVDEAQLLDLAQWGIAFLVFLFGVRIEADTIESAGSVGALVGIVQAAAVGAIAALAGLGLGLDVLDAAYLGVAAALSSSLVSESYLEGEGRFRTTSNRLAQSIHFVEDLLGVLVLIALAAAVYRPEIPGVVVAASLGLFAVRRWLFPRMATRFEGDAEVMMIVGITFVVSGIAAAEAIGVSIAVGAFAAGLAVADEYPYSLELVDTVDDLTDFFVPIFFVTVGALVTVPGGATLAYTAILLVTVLAINPVITALALLRRGFSDRTAVLTGLRLDQLSEFSLIVAVQALVLGTIAREVFDAIVLAAVLTMVVGTYTGRHDERIYRRVATLLPGSVSIGGTRDEVGREPAGHVVIVGFEAVGEAVFEHCLENDRESVVIVDNPVHADRIEAAGGEYVVGDVLDPEARERARIDDAALVVSTLPHLELNAAVAGLDVGAPSLVVAVHRENARRLYDAGADYVVAPDVDAADRLENAIEAAVAGDLSPGEFAERVDAGSRRSSGSVS